MTLKVKDKLARDIASRILALRTKAGWSQNEMAKKRPNWSQSKISRWEKGEECPSALAIVDLCKVFGVTSDYLLLGAK